MNEEEFHKEHEEDYRMQEEEEKGSGFGGILIWILLLGGVNLCSWLFDWSFWIY